MDKGNSDQVGQNKIETGVASAASVFFVRR